MAVLVNINPSNHALGVDEIFEEADFSTALLTKCVSSFGRNDGFV